jgi:hypothetical protein
MIDEGRMLVDWQASFALPAYHGLYIAICERLLCEWVKSGNLARTRTLYELIVG